MKNLESRSPAGRPREFRARGRDLLGYYTALKNFRGKAPLRNALAALQGVFFPKRTILFFPGRPVGRAVAYTVCALQGYAITANPDRRFDHAVKYKNQTLLAKEVLAPLSQVAGKVINAQSLDISKRAVGEAFEAVFGYPLAVDPVKYQGRMIEKSNENAAHDGRVIEGPILQSELKAECVYQKEIDNAYVEVGYFYEYRVPVYGGQIPITYLKTRPAQSRFLPQDQSVSLVEPSEVFSAEEKDRLVAFAAKMGLDFGELDVLRDSDGRIYVVDANNTPFGPPRALPEDQKRNAAKRLGEAFASLLQASA